MKLTIHPAAFMFGALLLCVTWLSLRTIPPAPFSAATQSAAASVPRTQRAEVAVDAETLRRYRGEYRIADGTSIFIAVDGGHLYALAQNARFELLPFSPTEFFVQEIDAEVTFAAAGDGPASRFTARFPSGEMTAKRVGR